MAVRSVTRRPRSDGGAAVRAQVLEAVERLLADGASFTELPIGRIADEAQMARSTFYGHFPDKAALLIALGEEVTGDLFAQARAWAADPDSSRATLTQTLHELVTEHRRHGPLIRAVIEVAGYEPRVRDHWRAHVDAFADVLAERLRGQRDAGTLPAHVDPPTAALFVAQGTERAIALHVERRPAEEDAAFAGHLAAAAAATVGLP